MIEEALESPGFWILGGVGTIMAIIGWIGGKKMGLPSFPVWQLLVFIAFIWGAAIFWAGRE